uniref:Odorant receptor n=1 Tax=Glossina austeni TaxID=7395 RepID=A0A1A9V6N0_GLOAU
MNFKRLANCIRNLKPSNMDDDMRELNKLLSYHQDMTVDVVNEVFSFSLLINFFAAGALLCLAAVNVIAGSSFYDYIRHTIFLLVALADMYYVCKHADDLMTLQVHKTCKDIDKEIVNKWIVINRTGQRTHNQSTDISDAFAEHPWHNGSSHISTHVSISYSQGAEAGRTLSISVAITMAL